MSETTTGLGGLIAEGRALLARDEIGRPVAIHGSGCPDDGTVNLWDAHERLLMDSMSEGEANEIAWWLNNGSALLDAAQSAQQRAEAAERRLAELEADDSDIDLVMPFHEPNKVVYSVGKVVSVSERPMLTFPDEYYEPSEAEQDRDTARAENAALREALGEARESGSHGFACKLEQRDPPCGGWSDEQIAEECTCWVGRAAALTPEPPQRPQERAHGPEAGGGV